MTERQQLVDEMPPPVTVQGQQSAGDLFAEPAGQPGEPARRGLVASLAHLLTTPGAPCACCTPKLRQSYMRGVALAALVPGVASLLVLGLGSLVTTLVRILIGPLILIAFRLATAHLYPTSLGRLHLVAYAVHKWWTGQTLHSRTTRVPIEGSSACVYTIACFVDNYAYCIVDEAGDGPGVAALVDPADAPVVLQQLRLIEEQYYEGRGLRLDAVLTTHKHWDHQGGNVEVKRAFPAARVYGGAKDNVVGCTHPVRNREMLQLGTLQIEVIDAPGSARFPPRPCPRHPDSGATASTAGCSTAVSMCLPHPPRSQRTPQCSPGCDGCPFPCGAAATPWARSCCCSTQRSPRSSQATRCFAAGAARRWKGAWMT